MAGSGGTPRSPFKQSNGIARRESATASPLRRTLKREDDEDSRQSDPTPEGPNARATPKDECEELVGGDITVKIEPGKGPKLSRSSSKRVPTRAPPVFSDLPDATDAARKTFDVLQACTYVNKYIGTTEAALECDCRPEWGMTNL